MGSYQNFPFLCLVLYFFCFFCCATEVSYDNRALLINGERKLILSGAIHYPRSTVQMWPSLIKKAREGGLNAVETYVFWNAHEPAYREYDFSGNLDLVKFIKTIEDEGLYAILRIGPYVCAEWTYGGVPAWLNNIQNMTVRTNNPQWMFEMKTFVTKIVDMMKEEKLFASQGGPIILAQIENEYGNIEGDYGNGGKIYVQECAKFAVSLNIGVPWIMCQQADAPDPIINTGNGHYAHDNGPKDFINKPNVPRMWTENWVGWFKKWVSGKTPHRPAEDLAFAVARFFQRNGSLVNYYMYHGGTNFGRTAGGPYITTTYEYDAPLNEYGQLNQPKYGHLKELHDVLMSMEKVLLYGNRTYNTSTGSGVHHTISVYEYQGSRACFFSNSDATNDWQMTFEGKTYTIPAWSTSILPDCVNIKYNTARVRAPRQGYARKTSNSKPLEWTWRVEKPLHIKPPFVNNRKKGVSFANQLLDQKVVTNDTSDYLWYMTSVEVKESGNVFLEVNTHGHVVLAFFNGKHIGTQVSKNKFEQHVKVKPGNCTISLFSVIVGLPNYGSGFFTEKNGISGPVKLTHDQTSEVLDLTNNQWEYKIGLNGFDKKLWEDESANWKSSETLQTNRPFLWYKTTFKTPVGDDPVVLDLLGLGKGTAWVNGNNIGRYWLNAYDATKDGNNCRPCDYRGNFAQGDPKCATNCGNPSQRWYHVPRSFLRDSDNNLVVFEETGGNPAQINVQTLSTYENFIKGPH